MTDSLSIGLTKLLCKAAEEAFWHQFMRRLVERRSTGVRLVISDAHAGLKRAATTMMLGASWKR